MWVGREGVIMKIADDENWKYPVNHYRSILLLRHFYSGGNWLVQLDLKETDWKWRSKEIKILHSIRNIWSSNFQSSCFVPCTVQFSHNGPFTLSFPHGIFTLSFYPLATVRSSGEKWTVHFQTDRVFSSRHFIGINEKVWHINQL